jgi:hypothetical protein
MCGFASLLPHHKEQFLSHSMDVNCSKHLSKEPAVGEPPAHAQASPSGGSRPGWLQHAQSTGGARAHGVELAQDGATTGG